MKNLYLLLTLFIFFGCSEKEEIITPQETRKKLLKRAGSVDYTNFGKPKWTYDNSGNSTTQYSYDSNTQYFYDSENKLDSIHHIVVLGFWITPRLIAKYEYTQDQKIKNIKGLYITDYTDTFYSNFEYNGNRTIIKTNAEPLFGSEFSSEEEYIFESEERKKILEVNIKTIDVNLFNNTSTERNIGQRFHYDNNSNVINITTDFDNSRQSITFEYDNKINPFYYLKDEVSFTLDHFIPGIIKDSGASQYSLDYFFYRKDRNIKWMLRNSQNNVLNYTITDYFSNHPTTQFDYSNIYTYDEEGYPVLKEVYKDNDLYISQVYEYH